MAQGLKDAAVVRTGYGCNSACRFCDQSEVRVASGDPPADEIAAAAVRAGSAGGVVVLAGGEATMRPELAEWVALARGAGAQRVVVQTNGRMLAYAGLAQRLKDSGVDVLAVALHGPFAELHDYLTRTPGGFDQAVRGLRRAQKAGLSVVVNTVVTRPGYRHLGEMAAFVLGTLGTSGWRVLWPKLEGELGGGGAGLVPDPRLVAPHVAHARAIAERLGRRVWLELPPGALAPEPSAAPAPEAPAPRPAPIIQEIEESSHVDVT